MEGRELAKTMPLESPIYDGAEITELEFYKPTGALMRLLEEARSRNERVKKAKDFRSPTFVMLTHVTGIPAHALESMTFADLQKASDIAAELAGFSDDDDEETSAPGKS